MCVIADRVNKCKTKLCMPDVAGVVPCDVVGAVVDVVAGFVLLVALAKHSEARKQCHRMNEMLHDRLYVAEIMLQMKPHPGF